MRHQQLLLLLADAIAISRPAISVDKRNHYVNTRETDFLSSSPATIFLSTDYGVVSPGLWT